jgi:hypothetical protein
LQLAPLVHETPMSEHTDATEDRPDDGDEDEDEQAEKSVADEPRPGADDD